MRILTTVILLVILIFVGAGIYSVYRQDVTPIPQDNEPVFCTMDAKICPDGSAVGRVGPNCEFAACPNPAATSTTPRVSTIETRINQGVSAQGLKVTPLELIEDSRCPINAVCIQAGTVRIRTQVQTDPGAIGTSTILTLNVPFPFSSTHKVTLTEVMPAPMAGEARSLGDYRFVFRVER